MDLLYDHVARNLNMYKPECLYRPIVSKNPHAAPMITIGKTLPFDAVNLKLGAIN